MQSLLRNLLNRLDTIAEDHEEIGDTDVREAMLDAVFDGFVRPVTDYLPPADYGMSSDGANRAIHEALAWFISAANSRAEVLGLSSFNPRLAAFQDEEVRSDRGSYFDDYFGWINPAQFDESGLRLDSQDGCDH